MFQTLVFFIDFFSSSGIYLSRPNKNNNNNNNKVRQQQEIEAEIVANSRQQYWRCHSGKKEVRLFGDARLAGNETEAGIRAPAGCRAGDNSAIGSV